MRLTFAFLALTIVSGCIAPNPFTLTLTNETGAVQFLQTPTMRNLELQIDGEWRSLSSPGFSCLPVCGELGPVECILGGDVAADLTQAYALLPGDSVSRDYDGVAYIEQESLGERCLQKVPLTGSARVSACHSQEAIWIDDGSSVEPPETSGLLSDDPWGADANEVVNPECVPLEFTLEANQENAQVQI